MRRRASPSPHARRGTAQPHRAPRGSTSDTDGAIADAMPAPATPPHAAPVAPTSSLPSPSSSYARMTRIGGHGGAAVPMTPRASEPMSQTPARHRARPTSATASAPASARDANAGEHKPPLPPTPPPRAHSGMVTPMSSPDEVHVLAGRAPNVASRRRAPRRAGAADVEQQSPPSPPATIDLSAELFDAEAPHVRVMHVPNSKVGLVIGRDGRHVSFVQAKTGTRISIARDSWDGAKRRVEIEGAPAACAYAVEMIERLIDTSEDRSGGEMHGFEAPGAGFLERVSASAAAAARVIEADARAAMRDDDDGDEEDHELYGDDDGDDGAPGMVFGEDFDGRAPAAAYPTSMSARRLLRSSTGGGGASDTSPATATMTIPHTKVGMIIGRGGDNIKFIQRATNARVQIQTDAETPEGAPNRIVYLRGSVQACRDAARMINDQCIGRAMIHGGAGGGVSPPPLPMAMAMGKPTMTVDATAPAFASAAPPMAYFGAPYTGLYNAPPPSMGGEHHHAGMAAMMHHHQSYAAYWNSYAEYCQRMSGYGAPGVGTYGGYDASAASPPIAYYGGSGGGEQTRYDATQTKTQTQTNEEPMGQKAEDEDASEPEPTASNV